MPNSFCVCLSQARCGLHVCTFKLAPVCLHRRVCWGWKQCRQLGACLFLTGVCLYTCVLHMYFHVMMMIVFIACYSSLVILFEGLCSSNPLEFELSGFRRNWINEIGIDSPLLWPTEPRLHVRYNNSVQRRKDFHDGFRSSDHRSERLKDIWVHDCLCIYGFTLTTGETPAAPSLHAHGPALLPSGPPSTVSGFHSSHDPYCKEPYNSQGRRTQDGRVAVLTLFVFVLATTCTIFQEDLTPSLPPAQHPCTPQNFTPTSLLTTLLNLIDISFVCYSVL